MNQQPTHLNRRHMLSHLGLGFGSTALAGLLADQASAASPMAPRAPHHAPRAKRVIFLFMEGGVSHLDTFDHKPQLKKYDNTKLPFDQLPRDIREGKAEIPKNFGNLFGPISNFAQHGQSGQWMSDYVPHMHQHADELCFLKGMFADSPSHAPAIRHMHCGHPVFTRPSMGAWCAYGLGAENQNMPGYVAVSAPAGSVNCGNAFLPAAYQATLLRDAGRANAPEKIRYLNDPEGYSAIQQAQLQHLRQLNSNHLQTSGADPGLEGLIESFEMSYRMQAEASQLTDIKNESPDTLDMYGVGNETTDSFARQCLIARRLSESGVRFVQVTDTGWDSHSQIKTEHLKRCQATDQPIAALLTDLKQRGLLDETLVVWTGEFGRTPLVQRDFGRGHNPWGFTLWMAGGGVKQGFSYGGTDEFGFIASEGRVNIHDLHATILHLLGIDHEKLTFPHDGRDYRLTDVYGNVVNEIIA